MKHLVSMGELLIDFIPNQKGKNLKNVTSFTKMAGGAPANVSVCFSKLGGKSYFMGQVGKDPFGMYLKDTLRINNVDTSYLLMTSKAKTSLAFVSLDLDGERDFMFYRDPSADQLYDKNQIELTILKDCILHFCSVGLKEYPLKYATIEAIKYAKKHQSFISFDPNLRFALWDDHEELRKTVLSFIPYADILKLSRDELIFLTQIKDQYQATQTLFIGDLKYILITDGSSGATLYLKDKSVYVKAFETEVLDTTGAGDAFIGAFLYQLIQHENFNLDYESYLTFAHAVSALVVSKYGAIDSMPTLEEVKRFMNHKKNGEKQ